MISDPATDTAWGATQKLSNGPVVLYKRGNNWWFRSIESTPHATHSALISTVDFGKTFGNNIYILWGFVSKCLWMHAHVSVRLGMCLKKGTNNVEIFNVMVSTKSGQSLFACQWEPSHFTEYVNTPNKRFSPQSRKKRDWDADLWDYIHKIECAQTNWRWLDSQIPFGWHVFRSFPGFISFSIQYVTCSFLATGHKKDKNCVLSSVLSVFTFSLGLDSFSPSFVGLCSVFPSLACQISLQKEHSRFKGGSRSV